VVEEGCVTQTETFNVSWLSMLSHSALGVADTVTSLQRQSFDYTVATMNIFRLAGDMTHLLSFLVSPRA
jgi:hypothetical protein